MQPSNARKGPRQDTLRPRGRGQRREELRVRIWTEAGGQTKYYFCMEHFKVFYKRHCCAVVRNENIRRFLIPLERGAVSQQRLTG